MTALALPSVACSTPALNWSRISAWSGSFSLHAGLALLLLIPPVAMQLRKAVESESIIVTLPSSPLPVVREPDLPVPPIRIKKVAPAPPRPQITITAPIADPLPPQPAARTDSIAPPSDVPAPPTQGGGAAADAAPSALAYGTQTRIPYPKTALHNRVEGTVVLRVLVGEDGGVKDIQIDRSSGSRDLDRAAREAVMMWKFKPGMRGGVPYSGWARVPINFTLPL